MLALTIAATVHIQCSRFVPPGSVRITGGPRPTLVVEAEGRAEVLQGMQTLRLTGPAKVAGRNGSAGRFLLGLPDGISREYAGKLEVRRAGAELLAIVEMDREAAVAAIVDAEGAAGLPDEARKAQAVVTRSYLAAAHNRHQGFDFCDSEHCQLLKGLAHPSSAASRVTLATRGQVLAYKGAVVAAMYSANCGGHTRSLAQTKWATSQPGYPYFSVACPWRGKASGHGIGMCQMGAIDLANHGSSERTILSHYFPDTTIETVTTSVWAAASAGMDARAAR